MQDKSTHKTQQGTLYPLSVLRMPSTKELLKSMFKKENQFDN